MFGMLFATIPKARTTRQNWPNPSAGSSAALRSPPTESLAYRSENRGTELLIVVIKAAPKISRRIGGYPRVSETTAPRPNGGRTTFNPMYAQTNTRTEETLDGNQPIVDYVFRQHSLFRKIDSIICRERTPPQLSPHDRGTETQNAGGGDVCRSIPPRTECEILGRQSQDDEEYNSHGDPRVSLVRVHIFVSNETGDERQDGEDWNRSRAGNPRLISFADRSEGQSASDTVDRTPSNTRDRVQDDQKATRKVEGEREPGKN